MTGLLNRRGLNAVMEDLKKAHIPIALCMFDLDNLKKVNDTYGHELGDKMISMFCDLLKSCARKDDYMCRYGGDEFIVIFKNMTEEAALKRANEICAKCCESYVTENLALSCSGGVVICSGDDVPSLQLIERADEALYNAKRKNKGGCYVWRKG